MTRTSTRSICQVCRAIMRNDSIGSFRWWSTLLHHNVQAADQAGADRSIDFFLSRRLFSRGASCDSFARRERDPRFVGSQPRARRLLYFWNSNGVGSRMSIRERDTRESSRGMYVLLSRSKLGTVRSRTMRYSCAYRQEASSARRVHYRPAPRSFTCSRSRYITLCMAVWEY